MNAATLNRLQRRYDGRAPIFRFPAVRYTTLPEDIRNNAGSIPASGDGAKLSEDKSGNSSTNVLCLNGVAGNRASAVDSVALSITGDIDIRANVALDDWTPATDTMIVAKWVGGGASNSFAFLVRSTGVLRLFISTTGADFPLGDSTAAPTVSDFGRLWVRVTRVQASGVTTFYTSPDGSTWTQLGNTVVISAGSAIFDGTEPLTLGGDTGAVNNRMTGLHYRAQIYNGIAGTLAFDANFATASKLAPSFTESSSNAATVTINTSGATGARISGARDLYQGTAANQPILTIAAAGNYLTFDGSNDYLKAAAFSLSQPETVYFVGSQVTWTINDIAYDGNSAGERMALYQETTTPRLTLFANAVGPTVSTLAVATNGIITSVFNGASSSNRLNRSTAATGNAGAHSGNGFVLGGRYDGDVPANITAQEVLVFGQNHDEIAQQRMARDLMRKNRMPMAA